MEYLIMLLASIVLVLVVFLLEATRAKSQEKKYIRGLYEDYEKLRDKKYAADRKSVV